MIDSESRAGEPPQPECADGPLTDLLAALLIELDASRHALDAAFHFDDRSAVKPAYDRLIRIAGAYRALPQRLKARPLALAGAQTAQSDARDELIATVDGLMAVLSELSAGIDRYHRLAGTLARLQARLAAALARPAQ
ncbi:hypothetical protein [Lysobacter enzymogenes]|uniref:Uncharacterized protein n=1 Tax=Lysobacter enzymogenes TaxID=69 RepID=A0A3N2RGZ9_LYSEN|nr:hypothetical protein [Lysobacter enzymogenes]ROU06718.1 hypothetical protein D9T17_11980 [Lysobacter enzymogenes]